jgi:signal transduction histidine kinase
MSSINNSRKKSPIYLADLTNISAERARIARELHDGIAQDLAAIGYTLDAEIGRSDTTAQSRKSLRTIREQITFLNGKVRNEIFQLRSARDLQPYEQLEVALESLGVEFTIDGALPASDVGLELFKVIQELARNAKEHGEATRIDVSCTSSRVTIEHDGGNQKPQNEGRFGVQGIAERLANIGWVSKFENGFTSIEISELP